MYHNIISSDIYILHSKYAKAMRKQRAYDSRSSENSQQDLRAPEEGQS